MTFINIKTNEIDSKCIEQGGTFSWVQIKEIHSLRKTNKIKNQKLHLSNINN